MDVLPVRRVTTQVLDSVLGAVSLVRQVKQLDEEQFAFLMQYSQVIELKPGEQVLAVGQIDTWLYFLVKGRLTVFAGESVNKQVNRLSPGEMFGDMAVLMHQPRSATIIADEDCKLTTLLRIDFSIFGDPEEVQNVSLPVKLLFYRAIVHNLRWRIESYRKEYPEFNESLTLGKLTVYTGAKDSFDELLSLESQAQQLSDMLERWNEALTR